MNEDVFNMSLRKFLKKVGVTSQREIEKAVRAAVDAGKLSGRETLDVVVHLKIEALELAERIDGRIELE
jgi:ribosomal protein L1